MVHVAHGHFDLVVRVLAGDEQAFQHLGQHRDAGLKVGKALRRVAVHGDMDERDEGEAEFFGVQQRAVADDEAGFFQRANSALL